MPFVTTGDGTELHYEVEGEGFPLVFTHGNMGFGQQFFLQTRVFRRHHRCVLHDSRGCGLSGKPTDEIYDVKTQAADLHSILRTVGVEKAIHIGHSFGGPIALQFYFDHPDEVSGLVLIGSYSAGRQLAITEEQVLSLYDTIQGRHSVFETFITHEKFARFNPYAAEIEAMLQREACKPHIYASKATCRGFFRLYLTERLCSVRVPALVVCGDADKPVPLESASRILAEGIPDARLVVVKDAAHFPHMEKPEIVNEAMWHWLRERLAV
jgi:pimeloyl-ACP methyl ester carboxylesterase